MVPLAVQLHWTDVARMAVHIQFIIFWESMSRRSLFLGVEGVTLSISKTYSIDSIKNIIVNPYPVPKTNNEAQLAQWIERLAFNQMVGGSSPSLSNIF